MPEIPPTPARRRSRRQLHLPLNAWIRSRRQRHDNWCCEACRRAAMGARESGF